MNSFQVFSAFRKDKSKVQLKELLSSICDNSWVWSIYYFGGIGNGPDQLDIDQFSKLTKSKSGYLFEWLKIKSFADQIEDLWDCAIIANKNKNDQDHVNFEKRNFNSFEIAIEVFDSTEWLIWAQDQKVQEKMFNIGKFGLAAYKGQ